MPAKGGATTIMRGGKRPKGAREARTERLEAQLRANLKRRKEQVRSRTRDPATGDVDNGGAQARAAAGPHEREDE
ncbi:MAG: hypothetical protein AB7I44_16665 [Hyphomicrobiaceae bacterium]